MKALSALIILTFLIGCAVKPVKPGEYAGKQIYFGQGGGFSGVETRYCLQENGHVYRQMGIGKEFEYIGQTDREFAVQMWENYRHLGLHARKIYEPGNIYYLLEFDARSDEPTRLVWDPADGDKYPEVRDIHSLLQSLANRLTATK